MILPAWAFFGLLAASLSALMMLLQERFRLDGYALAFWCKVTCVLAMLPFVIVNGLPQAPLFYLFLGLGAAMYAISDVFFFRAIPRVGAGVVSRILPGAVILSFLLWFAVRPELIGKYMAAPVESGLIFLVLCLATWLAAHLRKCPVSMAAVRALWFVIFAATIGPVLAKLVTMQADIAQGPYAYVFVEGLMMLTLWSVFFIVRRPVPVSVMFARETWTRGMMVGCVMAAMVLVNVIAFYHIDNPAYIPAIKFLDTVIILAVYAATRRKAEGNLWAGLGVVFCAAALVVLKAQV